MDKVLYDPNVVYLILVFGLWAGVTAAYIPGTGVVELVSLATVVGSVFLLTGMPTNWVGVVILVLGVISFLMIPFLSARWARIAEGGLILQAAGSFMLFYKGQQVSWILIALMIVISIAYHRFVLLPLMMKAREHKAVVDDDRDLVGAGGRVVKNFVPIGSEFVGSVQVNGEQWSAISDHKLESGEEVVVIERNGLQLAVEGIKHKQTPQSSEEEN
ncbi:MAG: hypothetical protein K8I60_20665 [Anaerolineae bacterium]|nr:hypothetical protein [Anaerolineae bacterium]